MSKTKKKSITNTDPDRKAKHKAEAKVRAIERVNNFDPTSDDPRRSGDLRRHSLILGRSSEELYGETLDPVYLNAWKGRRESELKRQLISRYGHEDYPGILRRCVDISSDLKLAEALARVERLINTAPAERDYFIRKLIFDIKTKIDQRNSRLPENFIMQKRNEYASRVLEWLEGQSKRSGKRNARIPPLDDILVRRNAERIRELLEENGFMSGRYFTGKKLPKEGRRAPARQFLYLCYYLCTKGFIKDDLAWDESADRKVIIGAMTSYFLKKPFSDRSMRDVEDIIPRSAYTTFNFL